VLPKVIFVVVLV